MALTVWVASGIFSMVGAYCYAELGCMIKKTGGDYAYVMDTFGGFLAFMRLYVESMIIRPCTVAIVSLSFAVYSVKYIFPECDPPDEAVRLLAAICIGEKIFDLMKIINYIRVKNIPVAEIRINRNIFFFTIETHTQLLLM